MSDANTKDISSAITKVSVTLERLTSSIEHLDGRLKSVESHQEELQRFTSDSKRTDWRLLIAAVALFAAGLGWVFSTVSKDRENEMKPLIQSIQFSDRERSILLSKIIEESQDRKDDIKRHDQELDVRGSKFEKIYIDLAILDERQRLLNDHIDTVTGDRFRRSEFEAWREIFQNDLDTIKKESKN